MAIEYMVLLFRVRYDACIEHDDWLAGASSLSHPNQ
jgi:hypothetical protein